MLIEFGPGDAAGTAGCDPAAFVEFMYGSGYALWEWGRMVPLATLVNVNIPAAINGERSRACAATGPRAVTRIDLFFAPVTNLTGTGRRVFEAWFIRDDYVEKISVIEPSTGQRKLKSDFA